MRTALTLLLGLLVNLTVSMAQDPKMVLMTSGEIPDDFFNPRTGWKFAINLPEDASQEDKDACWIDWNNDGTRSDDERVPAFGDMDFIEHEVGSKTITIYGPITAMRCEQNALIELDVTANPSLEVLFCDNNKLSALNLGGLPNLYNLSFRENPLTQIDLSQVPNLTRLGAGSTGLTSIDLSLTPKLEHIDLSYLKLDSESLDLSALHNLQTAGLLNMDLTSINLEGCVALTSLMAPRNQFTTVNLSDCVKLEQLDLSYSSNLSTIDLSNLSELKAAVFENCALETIDISKNQKLQRLNCFTNLLTDISIENNPNLTVLILGGNAIEHLDLSNTPKLQQLHLSMCHSFSEIDLTHTPELDVFEAAECAIESIDLSNLSKLTQLSLHKNKLTQIDLSHNPLLKSVSLHTNQLTQVTLGSLPNLKSLHIGNNKLSSIDLSGCTALNDLELYVNEILYDDMEKVVNALPTYKPNTAAIYVVDSTVPADKNECQPQQVESLTAKGWVAFDWKNYDNQGQNPFTGNHVSVESIAPISTLQLYPNPTTESATLVAPIGSRVTLYTADGILLRSCEHTEMQQTQIDNLPSGKYLIRIVTPQSGSQTMILTVD